MAKKTQKAQVVSPKPITELELVSIETDRLLLERLRKQVREAEAKLEQAEKDVLERLMAGATVQGHKTAVAKTVTGPSRPHWKDEYVAHFESEHGETRKSIEEAVAKKYPGTPKVVLVIGEKQTGI
jgi:hypothetical protein